MLKFAETYLCSLWALNFISCCLQKDCVLNYKTKHRCLYSDKEYTNRNHVGVEKTETIIHTLYAKNVIPDTVLDNLRWGSVDSWTPRVKYNQK